MGMEQEQQPEDNLETLAQKLKERGIDPEKVADVFIKYLDFKEKLLNSRAGYNFCTEELRASGTELFEDFNSVEWPGNGFVKDTELRKYLRLILDKNGISRDTAHDELVGDYYKGKDYI